MAAPRVIVLRAPGTNCDEETAYAFELAGAIARRVHVHQLLERPAILEEFQVLCLPGGFSYGDDIGAGRILADQLQLGLADAVQQFHARDTLILGICNGFQVLLRTGLLVSQTPRRTASLTWNDGGRFEDRWVRLQVKSNKSVFLNGLDTMELPIAHAEGKLILADTQFVNHLTQKDQIALCYTQVGDQQGDKNNDAVGEILPYPINPNGSMGNIAGLCDETGRVLGLMPHPERFLDPLHHPRWTRFKSPPLPVGRVLFENATRYFA